MAKPPEPVEWKPPVDVIGDLIARLDPEGSSLAAHLIQPPTRTYYQADLDAACAASRAAAIQECAADTILAANLLLDLGYATDPRLEGLALNVVEVSKVLRYGPSTFSAPRPSRITLEQSRAVIAEYRSRRPGGANG
ncbi:MAG TPA: hypothetical protein VK681_39165 [Reyranella sp.]|nr:hypothetical protein [Reyranella sp.]